MKKLTSKKWSDKIVKYTTFACSRSRESESKFIDQLKLKPIVKAGCDAKIGSCQNEDGKEVLLILNLQHNHGLSPDKNMYFLCNRRISIVAKSLLK